MHQAEGYTPALPQAASEAYPQIPLDTNDRVERPPLPPMSACTLRSVPRYRNTEPHPLQGLLGFLRWRLTGSKVLRQNFPMADNDPGFLRANGEVDTLTWIGHSTLLVQLGGLNLLTDPQFSERASPVRWLGPRRLVPPGLSLSDLPPIDLLLVSHNHYDHLDRPSIRALARLAEPPRVTFAPAGLGRPLERWGLPHVIELGWWQSRTTDNAAVHSVPVKHSSARLGPDRNRTLWTGWIVEHNSTRFFFAGDTAYGGDFREIHRRLGPVDLAALPIGAYEPRWFMRHVHATPEEAVQIHRDLGCRRSVAMHWGTFALTDEPLDEPPRRLAAARQNAGLEDHEFVLLRHGETIRL